MKKISIAFAALTAATGASAQSNGQFYGIMDLGVEYLSNASSTAGSRDSALRMSSGNLAQSRWGIRGSEDLGGGASAFFVLESGIDADTGMLGLGGRLFGRHAYVGLRNEYGTISLGRQQNLLFDQMIKYDPMSFSARYSAFMHDANLAGRVDNGIKYVGTFGGVTAGALYSLGRNLDGEVAGNPRVAREIGLSLGYAGGPIDIGVFYDQYQGNTIATQDRAAKRWAIGTSYDAGFMKGFAGFRSLNDEIVPAGAPVIRSNLYWVGASFKLFPAFTLTGSVYKTDRKTVAQDPLSFVVSGSYAFSKRTDVYVTVGHAKNENGSALGLNGFGNTVTPGENQTGVVTGIRHRF